jgi:hypothetical protein
MVNDVYGLTKRKIRMKKMSSHLKGFAVATLVVALALFHSAAMASSCKGLSQSKCSANAACSWVKSYKTKSGKKVDAYCRAKPGKSKKVTGSSSSGEKASKAKHPSTSGKAKTSKDGKKKSDKSKK